MSKFSPDILFLAKPGVDGWTTGDNPILPLDDVIINKGGGFSSDESNKFIAPVPGIYQFSAIFENVEATSTVIAAIKVNNKFMIQDTADVGNRKSGVCILTVKLNKGDQVRKNIPKVMYSMTLFIK